MASKKTTRSGATTRSSKRASNATSLQRAMQEQRKIERMLDEEFESLAQARRELRKQSEALSKRAEKQLVATKKRVSSTTKQIEEIESLLGEEFESLAQATLALRNETEIASKRTKKTIKDITKAVKDIAKAGKGKGKVKVKKQVKAEPGPKPIHTIKELTTRERKTVNAALDNMSIAKQLDKTIKPNQYIAAEVQYKYRNKDGKVVTGYARTHNAFKSFAALFKKLKEYAKRDKKLGVSEQKISRWLNKVKIITVNSMQQHEKQKANEVKQHERDKYRKVQKPAKKQTKKNATKRKQKGK